MNLLIDKKIAELMQWLDFMIENQEELKIECEGKAIPLWNVGYLEALLNMREELKRIDYSPKHGFSLAQEELSSS